MPETEFFLTENLHGSKKGCNFAPHLRDDRYRASQKIEIMHQPSGCSAVRLAHLLWEQGVPGSNPGTPTMG